MNKSLIEKYEGRYKIRALINLIPHIGGALDLLLSEKGSKWREERIELFLKQLDERLGQLEEKEIETEIINSEEFYDLMIQTLNSVIKTRHKEKIEFFSNILSNHIKKERKSEISSELMISILDSLTIDELHYFSELRRNDNDIVLHNILQTKVIWNSYLENIKKTSKVASNKNQLPQDSVFDFQMDIIWKMLSDKNLIQIEEKNELGKLDYQYSNSSQSFSSQIDYNKIIKYKITDFGLEFLKWIEQ